MVYVSNRRSTSFIAGWMWRYTSCYRPTPQGSGLSLLPAGSFRQVTDGCRQLCGCEVCGDELVAPVATWSNVRGRIQCAGRVAIRRIDQADRNGVACDVDRELELGSTDRILLVLSPVSC